MSRERFKCDMCGNTFYVKPVDDKESISKQIYCRECFSKKSDETGEVFAQKFIELFPEYKPLYYEHIEFYEELLGHVFFGEVNEELIKLIANRKEDKLQRMFDFYERMMQEDITIQNVITVTILERLGDDPEILKEAYKYMGTKTRKASRDIERYWGRDYPC